jgi:exodeoxyribonuclease V gamma subunit
VLHVHHADHADTLVAGLARVLAEPLDDVFAIDQVAVHSRGLERWLAQRLSHHLGTADGRDDGICAAIDFPFPGHLLADVLSAATDLAPDADPWRAERLAWPLLGLLEATPGLARGTPLSGHLRGADDVPADGRFAAVRRVADLFDRYAVHRPAMLQRWAAGDHAQPVLGDGRRLPDGGIWQAGLWRALRDHLGIPSPAERIEDATARLRADPGCCDLPPRLSLFGLTALPASYLDVLRALGVHRDVHLFLLHPSPALWDRVERALAARPLNGLPRRDEDPVRTSVSHPLLRAWGRDAREMQVVMRSTGSGEPVAAGGCLPSVTAPPISPTVRPLLGRLQADIRGDVAPPGPPGRDQLDQRPVLALTDVSVQVHACHGRTRQVEVLRDLLLHRFAADPTLEPRDVLVLCPDIETFAPLVEAVFSPDPEPVDGAVGAKPVGGRGDRRPGGHVDETPAVRRLRPAQLRVRVADRSLKRTNPLLRVVTDLLTAADGRVAATDVRDLAGRPPVRARFELDDDDLARLDTWIRDLGIRWGLDADHRSAHGIATDANTWHTGMQRLLVGVAVADEDQRTVGEVVPYDDVAGSDVELAGRFASLLAQLATASRRLAEPRTILGWRDALDDVVGSFTDTSAEPWQRVQLTGVLDDVVRTAGTERDRVELALPEFRELIGRQLQGAAGRASHRTGDLTVCTLVPMRSVPHRIVCLLGMDDGAFPRRVAPDGDDLLEHDPRVGDRDPRTEDRQLLLDALLAAEEQLVVTYAGRDERTNDVRPPAVPIGELLDAVDRTVRTETPVHDDGRVGGGASDVRPASRQLTVHHPLHPFDPRNFTPSALGLPDRSFGSDPIDLAGARALARADRTEPRTLLPDPLLSPATALFDPLDEELIELDDLVRAVTEPIPTLLSERLQLRFTRGGGSLADELDVELDGLAGWAVGARALQDRLEGRDADRTRTLERARGAVPPGELARPVLDEVDGAVEAILALAETHGAAGSLGAPVEIDVLLSDGRRVVGVVDEVVTAASGAGGRAADGGVLRRLTYARLKERDRLHAWVRLLALTASRPDGIWRAATITRVRKGAKVPKGAPEPQASAALLAPLALDASSRAAFAHRELERLVELRDLAVTRPIPIVTGTSAAYADAVIQEREGRRWKPINQANGRWTSNPPFFTGEDADPAYLHAFGPERSIQDLLGVPADRTETGDGWDEAELSRFGRWALRLWSPLLGHEHVEDH